MPISSRSGRSKGSGIRWFTGIWFDDLRHCHFAGTRLLATGARVNTVAGRLGRANGVMTPECLWHCPSPPTSRLLRSLPASRQAKTQGERRTSRESSLAKRWVAAARPTACEPERMDLVELLALPGMAEECVLRSNVGFMALHGGSQDRGTEQIAKRAAEQAGASYYAILHPSNLRVHLTSRLYDPAHSAQLRVFLRHIDVAISVHGFGRDGFALWIDRDRGLVVEPYGPAVRGRQTGPLRGIILGGLNVPLLQAARGLFQERFAGYHVADERVRLGFHPENPVNLPSAHGIQVELPPGLRGIGDLGEHLAPRQDGIVNEVVMALVELATWAAELSTTPLSFAELAVEPQHTLPDGPATRAG
jgi:phage replication-related protein YjqB (UPF0714/DUF867 family)